MNDLLTSLTALGLVLSPALLKLVEHGDAPDAEVAERMCVAGSEKASVHRAFRGKNDIAARLSPGTDVHVVAERDNWRKVVYAQAGTAELGWIVRERLEDCESGAPTGELVAAGAANDGIAARSVPSVRDLPDGPPEPGSYRVHHIDVGTGLAVLVQGSDFNLLFDGGSSDDKAGGKNSRLVAYLAGAIGRSDVEGCIPEGDAEPEAEPSDESPTIKHVFLSHPHDDHGSLLDDVLACYRVENVWDVGVVNDAAFYRDFLQAVADEPKVHYHTAVEPAVSGSVEIMGESVDLSSANWTRFAAGEGSIELGVGASLRVIHADDEEHGTKFNLNSIVVRVDLGERSLLLTGDEEAGQRADWDDGVPEANSPEGKLLADHRDDLDVDILQVPHHGSLTSSRTEFLAVVKPTWALIGDGPKTFQGVDLPDPPVIDALVASLGGSHPLPAEERILNTNLHDSVGCPVEDRVGRNDTKPGGCDNWLLEISAN